MAVGRASMDGLWCGQGMAHLLRLYGHRYDNPATTAANMIALFDAGNRGYGLSESKETLGVTPPVKTIVDALALQQAQGKTPRLDLVLLSHQDEDHWTLINEMLDQVKARDIPLEVGRVIAGGTEWGSGAKAAIKRLVDLIPGENPQAQYYFTNATDYGDPLTGATTTIALDDVLVRTIIANTPSTVSKKNGTSAVVVVQLGGLGYVLPGDATFQTLAMANTKLKAWPSTPLPSVYMMSAPHHGALTTMTKKKDGDNSDLGELIEFVDLTRPYSVFASAGVFNSHKHPYLIILTTLAKYAGSHEFPDPHDVIAYDGGQDRWLLLEDSVQNVYTTLTGLTDPLPTADWLFDINDQGHFGTSARFFEAGVQAIIGVPQTNATEMVDEGGGGGGGDDDTPPPLLLARDVLPGIERGFTVRPASILDSRVDARGRIALPRNIHLTGPAGAPLPPPRRVRPATHAPGGRAGGSGSSEELAR
ncbi:hypothetical protein GCM10011505_24810 [Tistrella bauzanensis]|uniref:Metallo-beta-lactamase domain-containing protein n=2 Tax=Tistrella bauzanensis TaxID=657419 RepID=A0ABQ1IJI0_9PROT|nr:hypothetical protein GCM10011505_24810 [Tistrella bauzanensis]